MDEISLDENWLVSTDPPNKGDQALFVRFRMHPRKDEAESKTQGRPIYKSVEYVSISAPGDKLNAIDRPASRADKQRFRRQYEFFKAHQKNPENGTPMSKWPQVDAAQVEEYKYFNIHTVEQLAMTPDSNLPNMANAAQLKKNAIDFIEAARGNAPAIKLRAELEASKSEMAAMRQQMADQAAMMAKLIAQSERTEEAAPPKKRRQAEAETNP